MPEPRTLTEAVENVRTEWRALCDAMLAQFPESWRPAVPEALTRTYRIILIIAAANYVIVAAALLYAIATGQFDWSAG